jgi:hypothetical protein
MIAMHMVQMSIVQIVNVAIVLNSRMTTARLVLMVMIGMLRTGTHVDRLFLAW